MDNGFVFSANVDVVNGSQVVYDKLITPSAGATPVSQVFTRSTSASGTPVQVTDGTTPTTIQFPQFSKDASQIVMVSDKDYANFEVYA